MLKLEIAEELLKTIIRKFEKQKVCSSLKDNIWSANLADMQLISKLRSSHRRFSVRKVVLRNFAKLTRKHRCQGLIFKKRCRPEACNFIKKETPAQVFSYEFCKISDNNFFNRTTPVAASINVIKDFDFYNVLLIFTVNMHGFFL